MDFAAELLKGDYDCLNRGQATAAGAAPPGASEKIRVLFLIDEFRRGGGRNGAAPPVSAERTAARPVSSASLGCWRTLRFGPGGFPDQARDAVAKVIGRGRRGAGRSRRLVRLIEAGQADVVHALLPPQRAGYAILATRWAGRGRVLVFPPQYRLLAQRIQPLDGPDRRLGARPTRPTATRPASSPPASSGSPAGASPSLKTRSPPGGSRRGWRRGAPLLSRHSRRRASGGHGGYRRGPIKDYATFLRLARFVLDKHPNTRFLAIGDQEVEYAREMRRLKTWESTVVCPGLARWQTRSAALPRVDVAVLFQPVGGILQRAVGIRCRGSGRRSHRCRRESGDRARRRHPVPRASPSARTPGGPGLSPLGEPGAAAANRATRPEQGSILWSEDKILQQYSLFYERL